jgi:uncharacterized membrane protein
MSENTAATLSYVLGWLTGIIFFLIDKRLMCASTQRSPS